MTNYGTLLVVDDNPAIFTTLEICLERVFSKIVTLTTPDAILATLEQEKVDVILLDMNFSLGRPDLGAGYPSSASQHPDRFDDCLCRCEAGCERT